MRFIATILFIAGFAGLSPAEAPVLTTLQVFPPDINLQSNRGRQSFVVQAAYADGITRDVTAEAKTTLSNPALAKLDKIDIVGLFPDYASAELAWRAKAQATVDSAQTRYYIVHLHRLIEPDLAPPTRTA